MRPMLCRAPVSDVQCLFQFGEDFHVSKRYFPFPISRFAGLSATPQKRERRDKPIRRASVDLGFDPGSNLFDAPDIGYRLFIGRSSELEGMEDILQPNSKSLRAEDSYPRWHGRRWQDAGRSGLCSTSPRLIHVDFLVERAVWDHISLKPTTSRLTDPSSRTGKPV
jgi:hypothetical protein